MCTREKLANLCHEQWSGWMEYLFSKCFAEVGQFDKDTGNLIIPEWAVNRWRRQMRTPYAELPENDKESDRKEADRFLAILFSDGNQVAKNELADLRAELEKLKRQWAEDDRDITALEDENNRLKAELAAEKQKVIHCEKCGASWYDDGWTTDCPKCQVMDERKKWEEAEDKLTKEKNSRTKYQHEIYAVCNVLDKVEHSDATHW
jgi:rubrerythrin